jgi:hypothetical protein
LYLLLSRGILYFMHFVTGIKIVTLHLGVLFCEEPFVTHFANCLAKSLRRGLYRDFEARDTIAAVYTVQQYRTH